MATKNTVLILGNGISRLQYLLEINNFQGEVWGSNHVYAEYGWLLSRINGHEIVVQQAKHWKQLHGYHYRVITPEDYKELPQRIRGNSGVFLISQALQDGYDEIILCGFDFGGKDVWAPNMHMRDIENGLRKKWDLMLNHFSEAPDKIKFWPIRPGYDILSERYLSVFYTEYQHNQALQRELYEIAGMEIIYPSTSTVTEATRGEAFYRELLDEL